MQDNARPHVAGVCQQFLQDEGIDAMDWPARSPDLNPIEHIWDIMSRSIHQRHVAPQTVQELADALVQPQHRIPPRLCAEPPPVHPAHTRLLSDTSGSCLIVKFADDTAVVGRIANNDESPTTGRQEVEEHLEGWCRQNNLCINVKKTKEMIVDFRRGRHLPSPLYIGGTAVEVVSSFRYLGVHISDDLTWSKNTSCLIRKAHQRLYFLRRLRRAGLGSSVLTSFYRCVVESVLSSCIIVWHGSCSAAEKKALQRVVKAAQRTVGRSLPTTTDIYTSRCRKRASCIMKDPTHSHCTCTVCPPPLRQEAAEH
ncbi:hypothetical protein L3Q82_021965 [Scortum barcoo]|uniref:Uncharacterized protein n=1 Tax=Scortum barcoo TaxID=214431 RepID=A0ACB8X1Q6_9TELE|nr:hypothetical protein L3Q82_021965 [Scortum barcoo]